MTSPPSKPPPDVLSRLVKRLERQLSRREPMVIQVWRPQDNHAESSAHDFEDYLARRIDRAVAPLRSLLDEHDVSFIGALLRDRLATDPNLARLVRRLAQVSHEEGT